jgi:polyphosphate glucokinase
MKILAIDIGGTGLKAAVIDASGRIVSERLRMPTPYPCPPRALVNAVLALIAPLKGYQRIAVGFPGVVRNHKVITAPHFGNDVWRDYDLGGILSRRLKRPLRMINDAEMQGLAVIRHKGLELVITLGTGVGSALFRGGELMPHMELAHHPIRDDKTYNQYLGDRELKKIGRKKWNARVRHTIEVLETFLNFDHLYIGGGNAKRLDFKLPHHVTAVSNVAGLEGGAMLWRLRNYA